MRTRRRFIVAATGVALAVSANVALARSPGANRAPPATSKTIVETVSGSRDHRTLAALLKAAGLVDTLSGPGPFTLFAPTDEAFAKLPPGAVDNLKKPENKAQLQTVLTYHVVPGSFASKELLEKIKEGGGKAQLKTIQSEPLTVEAKGRTLEVTDAKGDVALVTTQSLTQSNGVIHVVNTVLLP